MEKTIMKVLEVQTSQNFSFRANAFESQYRENAPRQRVSLYNRLKLVLKHP